MKTQWGDSVEVHVPAVGPSRQAPADGAGPDLAFVEGVAPLDYAVLAGTEGTRQASGSPHQTPAGRLSCHLLSTNFIRSRLSTTSDDEYLKKTVTKGAP